MKQLQDYTMVVRPDDNGTFVAYLPAIPGCHAWGDTSEQACEGLVDVFGMIQEEYRESEKPLPEDVEVVIANAIELVNG
jgi:predicted RNase H-like HicB family nuclease